MDDIISTANLKEKLNEPEKYMQGKPKEVYDFYRYVATRLPDTFNATGFCFILRRILDDTQSATGLGQVLGHDETPIPDSLDGAAHLIAPEIPAIAEAFGPEDFAEQVRKIYQRV